MRMRLRLRLRLHRRRLCCCLEFVCVCLVQVPQIIVGTRVVHQYGKAMRKHGVTNTDQQFVHNAKYLSGPAAVDKSIILVVMTIRIVLLLLVVRRIAVHPRRFRALLEFRRGPVHAAPRCKPRETRGSLRPGIDLVHRQKANQKVPPTRDRFHSLVFDHCRKDGHFPGGIRQHVGKGRSLVAPLVDGAAVPVERSSSLESVGQEHRKGDAPIVRVSRQRRLAISVVAHQKHIVGPKRRRRNAKNPFQGGSQPGIQFLLDPRSIVVGKWIGDHVQIRRGVHLVPFRLPSVGFPEGSRRVPIPVAWTDDDDDELLFLWWSSSSSSSWARSRCCCCCWSSSSWS
mmetsp:Transcript_25770/g.55083  ORF Transcript_25770/g.55083 Transcript_25770/m.55083 type:complete len:341 (+) Transcript_25770:324-1346(+)